MDRMRFWRYNTECNFEATDRIQLWSNGNLCNFERLFKLSWQLIHSIIGTDVEVHFILWPYCVSFLFTSNKNKVYILILIWLHAEIHELMFSYMCFCTKVLTFVGSNMYMGCLCCLCRFLIRRQRHCASTFSAEMSLKRMDFNRNVICNRSNLSTPEHTKLGTKSNVYWEPNC